MALQDNGHFSLPISFFSEERGSNGGILKKASKKVDKLLFFCFKISFSENATLIIYVVNSALASRKLQSFRFTFCLRKQRCLSFSFWTLSNIQDVKLSLIYLFVLSIVVRFARISHNSEKDCCVKNSF